VCRWLPPTAAAPARRADASQQANASTITADTTARTIKTAPSVHPAPPVGTAGHTYRTGHTAPVVTVSGWKSRSPASAERSGCTPPPGRLREHALSSSANGGPAGRTPRSGPRVLRARTRRGQHQRCDDCGPGPGVPKPTGRPSTRVIGMIPPAVEVISTSAGTIRWPQLRPAMAPARSTNATAARAGLPSAASPRRPMFITPARRRSTDGQTILKGFQVGPGQGLTW